MTDLTYDSAGVPIREDILVAHRDAWRRIARPGNWFDGPTRVAIATETRNAPDCALCAERKAALSPYSIEGTHDSVGTLPAEIVEIVHRIVTDPGRLRKQWYEGILAGGMADTEYVEIVGVVCSTVSVDTFAHSMGVPKTGSAGARARRTEPSTTVRSEARARVGAMDRARRCDRARGRSLRGRVVEHSPRFDLRAGRAARLLRSRDCAIFVRHRDQKLRHRLPRNYAGADRAHRGKGLGSQPVRLLNHQPCADAPCEHRTFW